MIRYCLPNETICTNCKQIDLNPGVKVSLLTLVHIGVGDRFMAWMLIGIIVVTAYY